MKWILKSVFVCLLGVQTYAAREVQNGGGGVNVNGSYMTYYSANGKMLQQTVEPSQNIPGLDPLLREIVALPLKAATKSDILNIIDNSEYHRYYRLQGQLDPEIRKEVTEEYSRLYNIPADQVVIFALTNAQQKTTVLLPEFYTLRSTEQSAILMHESLWLFSAFTNYEVVVYGEQMTQAYLEDKNNPDKFYAFLGVINKITEDHFMLLKATMNFDLQHGGFPPEAIKNKKILAKDFLGTNYIKALVCTNSGAEQSFSRLSRELYFEMRFNYEQKQKSLFYRALADLLQQTSYSIGVNWTENNLCQKNSSDTLIKDLYLDLSATQAFEDIYALPLVNSKAKQIGYLSF